MKKRPLLLTDPFLLMLALGLLPSPSFSQSHDQAGRTGNDPHPAEEAAAREGTLEGCCEKLLSAKRSIYYLNARSYRMSLQLRTIYTRDKTLFFCLCIGNHSHLDYSVDSIRFFITDEKHPAKPQARWVMLTPEHFCGNIHEIPGKTREFSVFAFPEFTLGEDKMLVIDVLERNGGRHLQLQMDNFTLVKARPLEGARMRGFPTPQ